MWLLSSQQRSGFLVGIANQALWAYLIILTHSWGLLFLTVALTGIYIRGWRKWKPEPLCELCEADAESRR